MGSRCHCRSVFYVKCCFRCPAPCPSLAYATAQAWLVHCYLCEPVKKRKVSECLLAELREDIRVYAAYVDCRYCYALTCISLVPEVLGSDKPCYGLREEDLSIGINSATYTKEAAYNEPTKVAVRYINSRRDTYLFSEGKNNRGELLGFAVNQLGG